MLNVNDICKIKPHKSKMANALWNVDAYPDLPTLKAHSSVTIADLKGPGVITGFHIAKYVVPDADPWEKLGKTYYRRALAARGVILEVYYNDVETPAVRVPLSDFFADGCGGQAKFFSNLFVEKAPDCYTCFIPMPFEHSAKVVLVNETEFDFGSYSMVEYEELPQWDESLGYFHATWERTAFQLGPTTKIPALHIDGTGHLLGRSYSICTDECIYNEFNFIMEANNEFRIDGDPDPTIDYLGTEDSFTFSWGFNAEFNGPYAGMNFLKVKEPYTDQSLLSIYRFHGNNVIRFEKSLDLTINWTKENHVLSNPRYNIPIHGILKNDGGWVDYAMTHYWYQKEIGFNHKPMLPLEERCKLLLKNNPKHKSE